MSVVSRPTRNVILMQSTVTIYVCIFVCYATPPRSFASRASNFQGYRYDPVTGSSQFIFFEIHPAITLSTNNRITLCGYYVQLSATLREKLRTFVANIFWSFCLYVTSYKGNTRYYNGQCYVEISRDID